MEGDLKLEILSDFDRLKKLTTMVTGATGTTLKIGLILAWRPEGITYNKNQVWIDIIESVNVLLSNKGSLKCLSIVSLTQKGMC